MAKINKKSKGKSSIILNMVIGLIGLIILVYYLFSYNAISSIDEYVKQNDISYGFVKVETPSGNILARLATSSEDLERGLSGTKSLSYDEGMLFVFQESGSRGFWMHDMSYSIDIIWLNQEKKVIGVTSDISPETYPNIFFPPEPVKYVLELNAGYAEENNIASGTPLTFVI